MYDLEFTFMGTQYYGLHDFLDKFDPDTFGDNFQVTVGGTPVDKFEFLWSFAKTLVDKEYGRDRDDYDYDVDKETDRIRDEAIKECDKSGNKD